MLTFQPKPNTIVMCDFSGFISPEMVKKRPVIVIKKSKDNPKLVTIVPFSTTEPHEVSELHVAVEGPLDGKPAWVKCDMITSVVDSNILNHIYSDICYTNDDIYKLENNELIKLDLPKYTDIKNSYNF